MNMQEMAGKSYILKNDKRRKLNPKPVSPKCTLCIFCDIAGAASDHV